MTDAPRLPAAVLWDMDGTLVDTEPYWIGAEYALVEAHGGTWTDDDARAIVGSALLTGAAYIRERGGVDLTPEEIVDELLVRVIAGVRDHLTWQPGARQLLAALREANVPCALVTMSYASLADSIVALLPEGTFSAVVTGDQVSQGKPHPEPYLLAAERLGVEPADCVAIEDSPTGVASAEAAGCITIAVPHLAAVDTSPGRTVVDSLADLSVDVLCELAAGRRVG